MALESMNSTMDRLLLLIRAGHPVIYLVSHEEARVMEYMAKIVRILQRENPAKQLISWYEGRDLETYAGLIAHPAPAEGYGRGYNWLSVEGFPAAGIIGQPVIAGTQTAHKALENIKNVNPGAHPALNSCIAVFFDLHPYLRLDLTNSQVRQLRNTAKELRRYYDNRNHRNPLGLYRTIIIVAPGTQNLSSELERDIVIEYFPLPEMSELRKTLITMLPDADAQPLLQRIGEQGTGRNILRFAPDMTDEEARLKLCDMIAGAGRGLTLVHYQLGLNEFAVKNGQIEAQHIEDMLNLKATSISQSQALQYTPHVNIDLGGLNIVKEWIRVRHDAVTSETVRNKYFLPPPKGVMLCGVSGGGKSQLAKFIAREFNLALLRLDVGALFGSYVGESEERTRQALQLAEVLSPVVVWIDEIDKAFSGIGNTGDNGVSARVFGHFLTWLAEKEDSVFVVVTANDFRRLLNNFPEFGRKGRFSEIFWIDLPSVEARRSIFDIYLRRYLQNDYLLITPEDITNIQAHYPIIQLPEDEINQMATNEIHRLYLCLLYLLSDNEMSQNMTGAEIEHAINDALYGTYNSIIQYQYPEKLTVHQLVIALNHARNSALYQPGSPDFPVLITLREVAQSKGWPFADEL